MTPTDIQTLLKIHLAKPKSPLNVTPLECQPLLRMGCIQYKTHHHISVTKKGSAYISKLTAVSVVV